MRSTIAALRTLTTALWMIILAAPYPVFAAPSASGQAGVSAAHGTPQLRALADTPEPQAAGEPGARTPTGPWQQTCSPSSTQTALTTLKGAYARLVLHGSPSQQHTRSVWRSRAPPA